jgi:hypothetical protein
VTAGFAGAGFPATAGCGAVDAATVVAEGAADHAGGHRTPANRSSRPRVVVSYLPAKPWRIRATRDATWASVSGPPYSFP